MSAKQRSPRYYPQSPLASATPLAHTRRAFEQPSTAEHAAAVPGRVRGQPRRPRPQPPPPPPLHLRGYRPVRRPGRREGVVEGEGERLERRQRTRRRAEGSVPEEPPWARAWAQEPRGAQPPAAASGEKEGEWCGPEGSGLRSHAGAGRDRAADPGTLVLPLSNEHR
jgi:hypothetical protein